MPSRIVKHNDKLIGINYEVPIEVEECLEVDFEYLPPYYARIARPFLNLRPQSLRIGIQANRFYNQFAGCNESLTDILIQRELIFRN